MIARGGEPGPVLAEIIGRTGGYNRGRGGTFHVIAKHLGILQTSAIVGGGIPLAAGAAFSAKTRGTDQVSLAFFGDGVLEEGAFHEGLNMASLLKLPLIFMCENNNFAPEGLGQQIYRSSSFAASELVDVAEAMNVPNFVVDGNDIGAVQDLTKEIVGRIRKGEGPFFVEARIVRWPGNVGQGAESAAGDFDVSWIWSPDSADPTLRVWLKDHDPIYALYGR